MKKQWWLSTLTAVLSQIPYLFFNRGCQEKPPLLSQHPTTHFNLCIYYLASCLHKLLPPRLNFLGSSLEIIFNFADKNKNQTS